MHFTREKVWSIAGTVLAVIPIGFFLLFALGEGLGAGWSHLVQALVPIFALALAWWHPRAGGYTLAGIGLVVGAAYFVGAQQLSLSTILLVEGIAFLPLVLAGICFEQAVSAESR